MDAHNERSKLVQRQKQERSELEKKVKKLKGAMKETAQKDLEGLEPKHEAELANFDKSHGVGGSAGSAAKAAAPAPAAAAAAESAETATKPLVDPHTLKQRHWPGLSKRELEEECVLRGLSKKGSKEDLVTKLTIFHQELCISKATASSSGAADGKAEDGEEEDEDEEDDEDDDEDEDEDEDEEEAEAVSPEEMEKQGRREEAVQKALRHLLKSKCPEGFPFSELEERLASVNVSNFAPEKLGYKTMEKFVKRQPEKVLRYDKKKQMILPP